MTEYFSNLVKEYNRVLNTAREARKRGYDPEKDVEVQMASDLAERVEKLVGPPGIAEKIRELSKEMPREKVALYLAEEILLSGGGNESSLKQALKTSLAILTEGVTAAPIQGISDVKIKRNNDGSEYLALYFAGPIRSAGGTEQALILVIADYLRERIGLDRYKPTLQEINRFLEEIRLYEREVARFQYHVPDDVLIYVLRNLPIEVTGPPTDPVEVSSFRNLPRVETNCVRGGALLVVNDGLIGRSRKLLKVVRELRIKNWDWLEGVELSEGEKEHSFLEDIVAGRPVFSLPSQLGGFRLRYGRSRNTGLAAVGIHPATMAVLGGFLAIGTQLKLEGPGKAGIIAPVDTIEGPIVKLADGEVRRVESAEEAEAIRDKISKILFLGDLLVAYGEFLENNKRLMPAGFCEEWWANLLKEKIEKIGFKKACEVAEIDEKRLKSFLSDPLSVKPSVEEALKLTEKLSVPLHPRYTYFWSWISVDELLELRKLLLGARINGKVIIAHKRSDLKAILEKIGAPHKVSENSILIEEGAVLVYCLKLDEPNIKIPDAENTIELLRKLGCNIMDKAPTLIGARMGRPEKAKERAMRPPVHILFPVGEYGGGTRDLIAASAHEVIKVEVVRRRCPKCFQVSFHPICPYCEAETVIEHTCPLCGRALQPGASCPVCKVKSSAYSKSEVDLKSLVDRALQLAGYPKLDMIKGVKGLSSDEKIPEHILKGVLRAKYGLYVFKDGVVRYDVTNAPLTHFKPCEIGVSVSRLRELGYLYDKNGNELVSEEQVCEMFIQDVIIPEKCANYLIRVAQFCDELLEKLYKMPRFYNVKQKEDLIGHLVIGLAPHTLVGVVGRVIGFTRANVCYAHPLWHAAKRRDCDGDEDALMLCLDVMLNFSRHYLPSQTGGIMDSPLLVSPVIIPAEVDEEVHNMDSTGAYPTEFYVLSYEHADSKNAKKLVRTVSDKLADGTAHCNYEFTHNTSDINKGVVESTYKKLKQMSMKILSQLALASKIQAVRVEEVARRVLASHFMRDIIGNLKAFSRQSFRCIKCNAKYRRVPLTGLCENCGGKISLTVHQGNVEKYLEIARDIARKYNVGSYYAERLSLISDEIQTLFRQREGRGLVEFI